MYWPAPNRAPNVYALSKQARSQGRVVHSRDGFDSQESASTLHPDGYVEDKSRPYEDGNPSEVTDGEEVGANTKEQGQSEYIGDSDDDEIISAKVSRGGSVFATITRTTLTIWQTKPTVPLTSVVRSAQSLASYGPNTALVLRPDGLIVVLQTSLGYLITYTTATDPKALVYQPQLPSSSRHQRRDSADGYNAFKRSHSHVDTGPGEGNGIAEVNLRFRMVIRIDAGISCALALDNELVVATQKPVALQTIKWVADGSGSQWNTDLVSRMTWLKGERVGLVEMVYDRPMNLNCWTTSDGRAYAVQRRQQSMPGTADGNLAKLHFQGFCFREPVTSDNSAIKTAINARFSLIAVGCIQGDIELYAVKDYMGNIPLSHTLSMPAESSATGMLTFLTFSPDGYCLFAGYEKGWAMWSIYGKLGANSFQFDRKLAQANHEPWLVQGVRDAFWVGGGCELAILPPGEHNIYLLDIARSAMSTCLGPPNVARGLLQSSSSITLYKGHDIKDVMSHSADVSLWQTVRMPQSYLSHQWPVRCSVISSDGRYVAVAGRRGLAHYSIASGRWRTFDDRAAEHDFTVRGGMCWWQNYLFAAVELEGSRRWQIRVYSRDKALDFSHVQHTEELSAPAVLITISGTDSLLVYTHENLLLHYIVVSTGNSVKLVQVGQIGFHGIIRAPPRVRSISWILPEDQLEHGDPSQDVATASVLFLVDAKLVLLQPSVNEEGGLKYDMRVIAMNVEYYILLRDQPATQAIPSGKSRSVSDPATPSEPIPSHHPGHSLRDSMWYFDGSELHLWSDIQEVLSHAPVELGRDLPATVSIPIDFYPLGTMVAEGIVYGFDAEGVQRRDVNFSFFRNNPRTSLFLPQILKHHLAEFNAPAALFLSQSYEKLPYFAHALEVLLHNVLDVEVDNPPDPPETALLPTVTTFLSSFPCYLDVVVNCTRKTELRSWRTLFEYLPPVHELFEDSLRQNKLKTAAGYLLVLHNFAHEAPMTPSSPARQGNEGELELHEFARLLTTAADAAEWELCKELVRFLVGIDGSGRILKATLDESGLAADLSNGAMAPRITNGTANHRQQSLAAVARAGGADMSHVNGLGDEDGNQNDYFSAGQRLRRERDREQDDHFHTPEP